jgi:hygromycin-B 7''-O-kinase
MTWPDAPTPAAFDAIARDENALMPGISAVLGRLGTSGPAERYPDGSLPVYRVGEQVLKLYPPIYAEEREREFAVLTALDGRLPVPTPRPLATGVHEGWGYVLMSRLAGEPLVGRWEPSFAAPIGEALAALHAIAPPLPDGWDAFAVEQRRTAVDRQRARGLDSAWLEQIPEFLADLRLDGPRVLLHTEVMREHLRVADGRLSGLFDFEPAMVGPAGYELASVGIFVTAGDRGALRALLRAYDWLGYDPREILGHALLHRYSRLTWYLERVPPPPGCRTLDALADCWFGC